MSVVLKTGVTLPLLIYLFIHFPVYFSWGSIFFPVEVDGLFDYPIHHCITKRILAC